MNKIPTSLFAVATLAAMSCGGDRARVADVARPSSASRGAGGDAGGDARDHDAGVDAAGSENATPSGAVASAATMQACEAFAKVRCARFAACSAFELRAWYGDSSRCEAREALLCKRRATFPGTGLDDQTLAACIVALPATSCAALLDAFGREPCAPSGARVEHARCIDDAQCAAGTRCLSSDGVRFACGQCAKPIALGGPCEGAYYGCADGLECANETRVCVARGAIGAFCDEKSPSCVDGATCDGNRCVAAVEPHLGAACTGTDATECGWAFGLTCDAARHTCGWMRLIAKGGECSRGPGPWSCAGGTHCEEDPAGYRCEADAADGASCREGACSYPAQCDQDSHTCVLPDATICR